MPWYRSEPLGSADSEVERDRQILRDRELEGRTIESVSYITLDYARFDEDGPPPPSCRRVTHSRDYVDPVWRYDTFDSVDFYIELTTDENLVFTIGWDRPQRREGLWIHEGSTGAEPFASWQPVAIWDASQSSQWTSVVGAIVESVEPRYRPWDQEGGFWCDLVTLTASGREVVTFLGDAGENQTMEPSPINLLAVSNPSLLPSWLDD